MNRLIIIGNGFDLAHGMKTSYNDFMLDYVSKVFKEAMKSMNFEDDLVSIKINSIPHYDINRYSKLSEYVLLFPLLNNPIRPEFTINFKSNFLKALLENLQELNWVDVEQKYFELLKEYNSKAWKNDIIELNKAMAIIRQMLIDYLNNINLAEPSQIISDIFKQKFNNNLYFDSAIEKLNRREFPEHTYFLDFNYTNLIKQYFSKYPWGGQATQIKIHGSLNDDTNPVIFGYGDEMDEEYKKIELSGNKEALKYIKSYWYSLTAQYRMLFASLEEKPFEVFVIGHSCGLSDRVMFSEIFQSPNCKFIRLFYYEKADKTDNYIETNQSISQHFSIENRHKMRIKVISKSPTDLLPKLT